MHPIQMDFGEIEEVKSLFNALVDGSVYFRQSYLLGALYKRDLKKEEGERQSSSRSR